MLAYLAELRTRAEPASRRRAERPRGIHPGEPITRPGAAERRGSRRSVRIQERGGGRSTRPGAPVAEQGLAVIVTFVPTLQWRDMKARLILNRLASRVRVLGSDPPADRLEEVESRPTFTAWVEADADRDELRALADVDGVASIRFGDEPEPGPVAASGQRRPSPAPPPSQPAAPAVPEIGRGPTEAVVSATEEAGEDRRDPAGRRRAARQLLMNLAGELVISRARFAQLTAGLEELFRALPTPGCWPPTSQDRLECLVEGPGGGPRLAGRRRTGRWSAGGRSSAGSARTSAA